LSRDRTGDIPRLQSIRPKQSICHPRTSISTQGGIFPQHRCPAFSQDPPVNVASAQRRLLLNFRTKWEEVAGPPCSMRTENPKREQERVVLPSGRRTSLCFQYWISSAGAVGLAPNGVASAAGWHRRGACAWSSTLPPWRCSRRASPSGPAAIFFIALMADGAPAGQTAGWGGRLPHPQNGRL
jgi:hypothetical protein